MDYEGLREHDRYTKKEKAAVPHQQCRCIHGTEECCEHETHEHQDLLEFFEAPVFGHAHAPAHYCITGDEPECEHLRQEQEEHEEAERRRFH